MASKKRVAKARASNKAKDKRIRKKQLMNGWKKLSENIRIQKEVREDWKYWKITKYQPELGKMEIELSNTDEFV
jgi:hypothetical protein